MMMIMMMAVHGRANICSVLLISIRIMCLFNSAGDMSRTRCFGAYKARLVALPSANYRLFLSWLHLPLSC